MIVQVLRAAIVALPGGGISLPLFIFSGGIYVLRAFGVAACIAPCPLAGEALGFPGRSSNTRVSATP